MDSKKTIIFIFSIIAIVVVLALISNNNNSKDVWHNYDGSDIICRVYGCGKRPVYPNWDDRFCIEHLDRSANHSSEHDSSVERKKYNTKKALTKEEAEQLRGTGYHGTRPYSAAENAELRAAMRTCPNCGMYADRGENNLCFACDYNKEHGLD